MNRYKCVEKILHIINIVEKEKLPLKINQIYLFGSFIEGKEEPNDIDMIFVFNKLTDKEVAQNVSLLMNGSSLSQKTRAKLKKNREDIDMIFETSLESAISSTKKNNFELDLLKFFQFFTVKEDVKLDFEDIEKIQFFNKFLKSLEKHVRKNKNWTFKDEINRWKEGITKTVLIWEGGRGKLYDKMGLFKLTNARK